MSLSPGDLMPLSNSIAPKSSVSSCVSVAICLYVCFEVCVHTISQAVLGREGQSKLGVQVPDKLLDWTNLTERGGGEVGQ